MAEVEIKIPVMGDSITEAVILLWKFEEGDEVEQDDIIMEIESDKATVEIPSPVSGFLARKLVNVKDIIKIGEAIAIIETDRNKQPKREGLSNKGIHSVMLKLGVICEHCNNAIPVNGFIEEVKCAQCNETTLLSGKLRWAEILNYQNPSIDIFSATKKHKPGEGDYGAWQPVKLKTFRKWPACSHCKNPYTADEMENAVENNGHLVCTKCTTSYQMKPAPEFIKNVFSEVLYSVDKLPPNTDVSGNDILSSAPVVMACMSCGGSLSIDGTSRLVPCKFCSSNNYLPDGLWFALHPQPKMEDWFIVFGSK